ncbi:MAG TPA: hypothetical protein VHV47_11045 [Opitutaceae bacterium]|jgi:hypothetical protein|nr:hypothetical protein [Opitutaceae bacterium]
MKTNHFLAAALVACGLFATGALAQTPAAPATPTEVVYVPQLPSAADLTKAAAAQNVTIERIDQTASQITVAYKYPSGQETTVSYQPLSAAGVAGVPVPATAAPAAPGSAVVYTSPGYYYDYGPSPYYYPWGWYPPVAIGLGFGFHGGFHGGFRGGFHGGGFRR